MPTITNLIIDSSSASNIDVNKSRVLFHLNPGLRLPPNAKGRVISTSLWYDNPNVIAGINGNNKITFIDYLGTLQLTIAEGIYGLSDIQERISELLKNNGRNSDLLVLQADESTSKISLQTNPTLGNITIDFTSTDNSLFRSLLGFQNNPILVTSGGIWTESLDRASLNTFNNYVIHSSFAQSGYYNNNSGSDVISVININVSPGDQITQKDRHPLVFDVSEENIDSFILYITTEDGRTPVKTNEPFNLVIELFT